MSTDEEYNKVVCDAAVRTKMRSREYYYSVENNYELSFTELKT